MKSFVIAFVFLVIGGLVGGFIALAVGTGIGAGVGAATGFSAGACSAMQAAKDQGLLTDAQFEQVLTAAAKIAGRVELPLETKLASTAEECKKVIADLQQAGSSQ